MSELNESIAAFVAARTTYVEAKKAADEMREAFRAEAEPVLQRETVAKEMAAAAESTVRTVYLNAVEEVAFDTNAVAAPGLSIRKTKDIDIDDEALVIQQLVAAGNTDFLRLDRAALKAYAYDRPVNSAIVHNFDTGEVTEVVRVTDR